MMATHELDLARFKAEVLTAKDPAQLLPVNLSDEWLEKLSETLEELNSDTSDISAPMALLLQLREAKGLPEEDVAEDELLDQLANLRLELMLERIRRRDPDAGAPQPATLDNVLTARSV
jgi:hypothetical protein